MECRLLHGILKFSRGIYKSECTSIKGRAGRSSSTSRVALPLLHFLAEMEEKEEWIGASAILPLL